MAPDLEADNLEVAGSDPDMVLVQWLDKDVDLCQPAGAGTDPVVDVLGVGKVTAQPDLIIHGKKKS